MTIRSVGRSPAMPLPQAAEPRLDLVRKKLGEGPVGNRANYLTKLAGGLFINRYEKAVPYQLTRTSSGWAAPAVDRRVAAQVAIRESVSVGTGAAKLDVRLDHDGQFGKLTVSRGGSTVPMTSVWKEPAFGQAVKQLGVKVARELLRLDPDASLD